jgi:hypothetical protein
MKTPTTEQWERAIDELLLSGKDRENFQKLLDRGILRLVFSTNADEVNMELLYAALFPNKRVVFDNLFSGKLLC